MKIWNGMLFWEERNWYEQNSRFQLIVWIIFWYLLMVVLSRVSGFCYVIFNIGGIWIFFFAFIQKLISISCLSWINNFCVFYFIYLFLSKGRGASATWGEFLVFVLPIVFLTNLWSETEYVQFWSNYIFRLKCWNT